MSENRHSALCSENCPNVHAKAVLWICHITLLQRMSLCRIRSMRGWVGFALWAHPKRLLNHWSHISSNLMNMQKRNSAKGNSRYDNKHMYWLCITVAVIYHWRLLVLQQSAATWLCVWYCFRLHKVIGNGKNGWSMHSRSAVFLNNTKTPDFTFLGVKSGVHFAICWFSAFIAEREEVSIVENEKSYRILK